MQHRCREHGARSRQVVLGRTARGGLVAKPVVKVWRPDDERHEDGHRGHTGQSQRQVQHGAYPLGTDSRLVDRLVVQTEPRHCGEVERHQDSRHGEQAGVERVEGGAQTEEQSTGHDRGHAARPQAVQNRHQHRSAEEHQHRRVGLGAHVHQGEHGGGQCCRDREVGADHPLPQGHRQRGSDGHRDDRPRFVRFPAGLTGEGGVTSAQPEPPGRVVRRQIGVGHVGQGGAVRQPGEVLGAKLLIHRDTEQIELGGSQRHRQRDRCQGRDAQPRQGFDRPRRLAGSRQHDGDDHQDNREDLTGGGEGGLDVGRVERRPVHAADRRQRNARHHERDDGRADQVCNRQQVSTTA